MGNISFSGVENAKANVGGNYVKPCDMIARIDRVKQDDSRSNGSFIANEMTVLHVFEGEHEVGENVTHMLMQKFDSFLNNWKKLVIGITSCPDSEVTEEASNKIVSEDQPLSGIVVRVKAHNIKTRKGEDFTIVNYHGEVKEEDWRPLVSDADAARLSLV